MYFHFLLALGQEWTATPKHWAFSTETGLFSQTALIESHYSSKWFKNPTGLNRTTREVKGRPVSSSRVGMVLQEVHHGLLEEQGLALIVETKIKKQCQHRVVWKKAGHLTKRETENPTNMNCGSVSRARVSGISSCCSGMRVLWGRSPDKTESNDSSP